MGIDESLEWAHKKRSNQLIAGVRTHSNSGHSALLEVLIAQGKEFVHQYEGVVQNVAKAYSVKLVVNEGSAQIIPATYNWMGGVFAMNPENFKAAKTIKLDPRIIEAAETTNPFNNSFVPIIEKAEGEFVNYFRQNCSHLSRG